MSSDRRSPWWPYLLVLAGLFVLSLAVPRGWQSAKLEHKLDRSPPRQSAAAPTKPATVRPVVVRPIPESAIAGGRLADSRSVEREHTLEPAPVGLATEPSGGALDDIAGAGPIAEMVARKIADGRRFIAGRHSDERLPSAHRNEHARQGADRAATLGLSTAPSDPTASAGTPNESPGATWPAPHSLLAQLDDLSQYLECRSWALSAKHLCETLASTPIDQQQQGMAMIAQLHSLAAQADGFVNQVKDPQAATELRRVHYSLERRLAAWNLEATSVGGNTAYANVLTGEEQRRRFAESVAGVQQFLNSVPHGDAWAKYLALDEAGRLTSVVSAPSSDEARNLARRVLSRLSPPQVTEAQRRVLSDTSIQSLAKQLRPLAAEPTDSRELLAEIERYEASRLPSDAKIIVAAQERLVWSIDKNDEALAQHLENHYRNANIRTVLTAELLNRFAPEPITTYGRVNDTIIGTPVHGQSVNTTEIQVRLIPDPRRVHLWVEAQGIVHSRTQSSSGPATLSNRGSANFIVRKAVVLDERGLGIANASTEANSRAQLTDVSTRLDGIPLIGSIVRNYAESQYDAMRDQARWEAQEKIAAQAGGRVHAEVDRRLQEAEDRVRREVLNPLARMDLELEPITMETLADRATMRLRLAGQHQLGGHTARPQALSDSLASVQVHESAANNFLDQLQLAGRTFELPELYKHLAQRTSRPEPKLPDDLPEGVLITFADRDPLRVRCEDDKLRLTLAIKDLRQGSRHWHDFSITTTYKPEVAGRQAKLVRDGIIELDGEAYKGQPEVALRGIFSKILSRERKFDLVPPLVVDHPRLADLCITQCTIEDGWIGIALGPDRNVVRSGVARRPTTDGVRK